MKAGSSQPRPRLPPSQLTLSAIKPGWKLVAPVGGALRPGLCFGSFFHTNANWQKLGKKCQTVPASAPLAHLLRPSSPVCPSDLQRIQRRMLARRLSLPGGLRDGLKQLQTHIFQHSDLPRGLPLLPDISRIRMKSRWALEWVRAGPLLVMT